MPDKIKHMTDIPFTGPKGKAAHGDELGDWQGVADVGVW